MKVQGVLIDFILKEWLLVASGVGLAATSAYTGRLPSYSLPEAQVLFILFTLFVAVTGLRRGGIISRFSRSLEKGKAIPLKLVVTTFFLSMLITNDAALIVIVPLTLELNIKGRDILVILEALAANAGSALTPFGNPQNLFIYWYYGLSPAKFITAIAPFSLVFLAILLITALVTRAAPAGKIPRAGGEVRKKAYIHVALLAVVLLTVLHILPVFAGLLVLICALLFDRKF